MANTYGIVRVEKYDEADMLKNNELVAYYDKLNHFALAQGFNGIIEMFAQLSKQQTNEEAKSYIAFLDEVRQARNNIVNVQALYKIKQSVFEKLDTYAKICDMC